MLSLSMIDLIQGSVEEASEDQYVIRDMHMTLHSDDDDIMSKIRI